MSKWYSVAVVLCVLSRVASPQGEAAFDASIQAEVDSAAKPWTSLDLNNDPNVFRFALVSDNAGGPRVGIFAEAVAKLNLLQPEFVIGTGDFIEGYQDDRTQLESQWSRFKEDISTLEMPLFVVPGNHDNGRPLWAELYNARFGVPYYHFAYKNVLFLCLSTNTAPENNTGISAEQIDYVARTLGEHKDVRWTFVIQHKPLWNEEGNEGWKAVAELLKGRKCTVFAGHTHNYLSQEKDGISFVTLATTGAGSRLRGPALGEFDQLAWVTMTREGPRVANVRLDGVFDKDFRTPEKARELALFGSGRAVVAAPIRIESAQFESAGSLLSITNPSAVPLRVKVLTEASPGMRVEPGSVAAVVPGGSKHEVELRISADRPLPATEVQPVVLHWTGYYDSGKNTPSTELAGETRIVIDAPFTIGTPATAPVIDGKLDDWKELPFRVDQPADVYTNAPAWKGPHDGSFRFGVSADAQYLYVAVKAVDNEPCFDGWKYWEDFAMVFVDGRAADTDDPKTSVFSVIAGPRIDAEQAKEFQIGDQPEGTKTASVALDNGFEAEFAVAVAYLNQRQTDNWQRVRLNVAFSDFDTGDARDGVTILYWRPQWTSRLTQPSSALFTKAAAKE